jgi:hypothetical protein
MAQTEIESSHADSGKKMPVGAVIEARNSTRQSITWANDATAGVKKSLNKQKRFTQRRKVAEGAKKQRSRCLRVFAPWRLCVRLFIFSQLHTGKQLATATN